MILGFKTRLSWGQAFGALFLGKPVNCFSKEVVFKFYITKAEKGGD
jgi:hypothetical protein